MTAYRTFVGYFINYMGEELLVQELTEEKVLSYIEVLYRRKLSKATIATYVRHVKIFLCWLESFYNLSFGAGSLSVPKTPKKHPHIYTDGEIQLIFDTICVSDNWICIRNCAMVALMLDSGLRQNEVCTLKRCFLDFDNQVLKVYGKGEKERIVPMGKITRNYLDDYLSVCPFESEYVFVTKQGKTMTQNAVKLFMNKLSIKLPFEFGLHRLRHNFATNFLLDFYEKKGCVDIYALMVIMGHENIETTKRYLHIANQIIYSRAHISHMDRIFLVSKKVD